MTPKEFGKKAVRRNQLIASLLHRIDFVENMGTGINKIKTLLKECGAPSPRFEFSDFFTIIFPRINKNSQIKLEKTSGKTSGEIIKEIENNPYISIPELATYIGLTERSIERNINKLKKDGVIERVGPAKGGYWRIIP